MPGLWCLLRRLHVSVYRCMHLGCNLGGAEARTAGADWEVAPHVSSPAQRWHQAGNTQGSKGKLEDHHADGSCGTIREPSLKSEGMRLRRCVCVRERKKESVCCGRG